MNTLIRVLETALPVLSALALGMFCRQKAFLTREGVDALKKVVINLTLPFVLLNAFASADYSGNTLILPVLVFALCCLGLLLGKLLASILRIPGRLSPFMATGFEAGMLGYALFALLFPKDSASNFAILDLGQTLFVFTVYKGLLSGRSGLKNVAKDAITSPILWAVAAGLLFGITGLYGQMQHWGISGILDSLTGFLSAPTGMIILLTVGYDLVLKEISWKQTFRYIILRMVSMAVLLLILIAINEYLLGYIMHTGAAVLLFLLPPPYVLPIFADEPDQRVALSSALSALTILNLLLFAVMTILI